LHFPQIKRAKKQGGGILMKINPQKLKKALYIFSKNLFLHCDLKNNLKNIS
jgi:hypothetical protein